MRTLWFRWFQSTHPHGVRRLMIVYRLWAGMFQSTHPHGVRRIRECAMYVRQQFQSTHPHGVRLPLRIGWLRVREFQSTHPHGVRHLHCAILRYKVSFNPRTRMGCDRTWGLDWDFYFVSIHAPAWGATRGVMTSTMGTMVSIHAPAWGATQGNSLNRPVRSFNPRTRMGCDTHLATMAPSG